MSTQITISPEIKLVVNTTPITGGSSGRILFQTTGNTVGQSGNLFWDNATNRLIVSGPIVAGQNGFCSLSNGVSSYGAVGSNYYYDFGTNVARRWGADNVAQIDFGLGFRFRVAGGGASGSTVNFSDLGYWSSTTGNLLVGTTTDAGFRLDVNGIARVVNSSYFATTSGSVGIGLTTPVGKTDILTGFADVSSLNQAQTFRLRSTTVDGNTRVMNFGISHTGVGGANQGYGYIQFGYSGGSVDNPLVLQPLGGGVSIGAAVATSDYRLQVSQESSIKASANSGGGALGGRLSFPFAGPYSGKVAYIAQIQDTTNWFNSAGLVFATLSGSDISALTGVERMRIGGNGNILINTTTDAGFRFDINGTARVSSTTTIGTSAHPFASNLLTLISDQGSASFRIGGGNAVVCTSSISAVNLSSNDFVQCVRVLVGGAARINATTTDWLSVTNWAQSSLGSGNLSANLATFGTTYATINASAQVEIASTTKGFLPPRMTNAQMVAITTPAEGLVVYDLTNKKLCCYDGATWQNLF